MIEAKAAPLRVHIEAMNRVAQTDERVKALRAEGTTLAEEAVRVGEDLEAAERRALPAYEAVVKPYRDPVERVARRRAEVADALTAAEDELRAARAAEASLFAGGAR